MRTRTLWPWRVRKRLCVSVLGGKPSIYFLVNIGYSLRPSVPSCPVVSRRVPWCPVVVLLFCPSVRPVVVVRPLSVLCPSVRPRRPSSVCPSVPSSVPSSSSVLCPSVHVRPSSSSSSVLCPSVRPVVRLNITRQSIV